MNPKSGWYSDPAGEFDLRFWDGENWTDQVKDQKIAKSFPAPSRNWSAILQAIALISIFAFASYWYLFTL